MPATFSSLTVHVVFSTKDRIPMMKKRVREVLFPYVGGVVKGTGGVVIAVGGTADHVHIVARVPAKVAIADFVRTLKANSSKWMNERATTMKFGWQRGYGAFSVSQSAVTTVARYVRNQERHHRHRTFEAELRLLLRKHGVGFAERYLR